ALVRDGLSQIDEHLFFDPRLADARTDSIAGQAEQLRGLQETQLFGIHAALDIPNDLYSPASIIAVPDASQPDWSTDTDKHVPPAPQPGQPDLSNWHVHRGGCPPAKTADKAAPVAVGPDWSNFLDSTTQDLLAPKFAPKFTDPPVRSTNGAIELVWNDAPDGSTIILEQASRHDFGDAIELLRDTQVKRYAASRLAEGYYYFRLRFELDGNSSGYAAHVVTVRAADDLVTAANPKRLRRIQVAMMRMAAGTGDFFAILSLPRDFRAGPAGNHARMLTQTAIGAGSPSQLGFAEQRALSYGALYHPWLVASRAGATFATAPDGAIAGLYAARATSRGAWIAPANDLLRDIVGLDPVTPEADLLGLDQSRVNAIRRLPDGFSVLDTDTLSDESDWRQVSVRRLMMLIRRAAMRRGMAWVFEPNGPVVRRAIEHSFTVMLDDLQRRGAFAGKTSPDSFRLMLPEATNDRDTGRLTVEIAVSPAQPLRFLTLRMAQQGARLSIAEVA
ncbi:MAG: hypothetical protein RL367_231, partial [Pseudomonadota bacterium]